MYFRIFPWHDEQRNNANLLIAPGKSVSVESGVKSCVGNASNARVRYGEIHAKAGGFRLLAFPCVIKYFLSCAATRHLLSSLFG